MKTQNAKIKVYIKAASVKNAAYKNGGAIYNGFAVMIARGDEVSTAAHEFGKIAQDCAAIVANGGKLATATDKVNAATAKNNALQYGRIFRRKCAAICAAASVAELIGGKLADKLAEQLEQARAEQAEWIAADERAKAERREKYITAHPEKAQAAKLKAAKAVERAKIALEKAQAQAAKLG